MPRKSIEAYETDIMKSVNGGAAYLGRLTMMNGQRERAAAERLKEEGKVRIADYLKRGDGTLEYACIPPQAEWDFVNFCIRAVN
jgi:hypothetical protein